MTMDCTQFEQQSKWLRKGSKGQKVEDLQKILKNLGYYKKKIDQDFGFWTDKALKDFQRKAGFTGSDIDGKFGPKTCKKLNETVNAGSNTTSTTTTTASTNTDTTTTDDKATVKGTYTLTCPNIWLEKGSSGDNVKKLQTHLKELGFYKATIDTDYGDETYNSVKAYQAWWNKEHPNPAKGPLSEDGIFGEVTCNKLKETIEEKAKEEAEATAKNKTTAKKPTVKTIIIDAAKYNVIPPSLANLTIEGLHFIITDITETNGYKVAPWKSAEMMNNSYYTYKGHRQPLEYSLTCYLHMDEYDKMKNALILLQEKEKCNVISTLVESGNYYIDITRSIDLRSNYKLVIHITEVM